MIRSLEEIIFQARALAQGHPLSGRAQAYVNRTTARERTEQPVPEIGLWAAYAMQAGYCLRRVEEDEMGAAARPSREPLAAGDADIEHLDELTDVIADGIRTDAAGEHLLYPQDVVIDALDHLIAGEVERRLSHWAETIDEESFQELESYVAWWTLKGYALRIAEQIVPAQEDTA